MQYAGAQNGFEGGGGRVGGGGGGAKGSIDSLKWEVDPSCSFLTPFILALRFRLGFVGEKVELDTQHSTSFQPTQQRSERKRETCYGCTNGTGGTKPRGKWILRWRGTCWLQA